MKRKEMKILQLLVLVFLPLKALSKDTSEWIRIDCGSGTNYLDDGGSFWWADENFIRAGTNKLLSNSSSNNLGVIEQLNSLRVFTEQNKNCYVLPVITNTRYFIKAGFHYGNYDGLLHPPTFDLEFNGAKWASVSTSIRGPQYEELIYTSPGESMSVCLTRTQDGQYPFISTLELLPLPDGVYVNMSSDKAWYTLYRYMYGASDWILGYPQDKYNRVWQPKNESDFDVLTADFTSITSTSTDYPPNQALLHAIVGSSSEFEMPLYFNGSGDLAYIELHFVEPSPVNTLRVFDIYIEDVYFYTIQPQYRHCTSFGIEFVDYPAVYLSPNRSDLPPIISAIEIYGAVYRQEYTATSQDDVNGLKAIINEFEQLQGWSGDPCLPLSSSSWQWLTCNNYFPTPNVTSMNLSGYGLHGHLPDFSPMQALETIDFGNNKLYGSVPSFLGKLPNLKLLILSNNNFSGTIPKSITKNKKLKLLIDGNHIHRDKRPFIVRLTILTSAGVLMIIGIIYFTPLKHKIKWPSRRASGSSVELTRN